MDPSFWSEKGVISSICAYYFIFRIWKIIICNPDDRYVFEEKEKKVVIKDKKGKASETKTEKHVNCRLQVPQLLHTAVFFLM
jgi:hypothetical protein